VDVGVGMVVSVGVGMVVSVGVQYVYIAYIVQYVYIASVLLMHDIKRATYIYRLQVNQLYLPVRGSGSGSGCTVLIHCKCIHAVHQERMIYLSLVNY